MLKKIKLLIDLRKMHGDIQKLNLKAINKVLPSTGPTTWGPKFTWTRQSKDNPIWTFMTKRTALMHHSLKLNLNVTCGIMTVILMCVRILLQTLESPLQIPTRTLGDRALIGESGPETRSQDSPEKLYSKLFLCNKLWNIIQNC